MAPTRLVIVESPAKCSKIQGFLGPSYQVIASLGHIRALKEGLDSVGLEKDFEAEYEFLKDSVKARAIQQLKEAAKGKDIIYLAADDDREGEFIAYSVALLLKLDPKTNPRAVFHEITETAVVAAITNPRTLDMNKVHAQQSRALLDMMIGFTMSPLLWKHVGGQGLSAGRCQTPALRLVADKEKEIANFKATSCWKVHGQWSRLNSDAVWPGDCTEELEDEESTRNFLENHVNDPGAEVKESKLSPFTENPPLPLITSTLQQQASTLFRSNLKNTMKIAQRLYEAGHITYMRTDQAIISEEAKTEALNIVKTTYGPEYMGSQKIETKEKKLTKTKKATSATSVAKEKAEKAEKAEKKTQDAHEAIRPTHLTLKDLPTTEDWSTSDRKVYQLIWLRTIQSVMAPLKGERRRIIFHSEGGGEDFPWSSNFQRTLFQGWRIVSLKEDTTEEKDSKEEEWTLGESLAVGTKLEWTNLEGRPHTTAANPRYTEASLIRELEKKGIGRPSTFANLLSTIIDKKYVEAKDIESRNMDILHLKMEPNQWPPTEETVQKKVGGQKDGLVPTALGKQILEFVLAHFDDLFQYSFTAQMEQRLDKIAEGSEDQKEVLRDTWTSYKKRYYDLKTSASSASPDNQVGTSHRKDFGGGLVAVMTKKGPVLLKESPTGKKEDTVFYGWPQTQSNPTIDTMTEEEAKEFEQTKQQEKLGSNQGIYENFPILKKSGPYGQYAEWNDLRIPWAPTDTVEQIHEKIALKKQASADAKRVGIFEIRKGPYGLYMFKYTVQGPKRQFVGLPETMNLNTITEAELIPLFQAGIQQKARSKGFQNNGPQTANASQGTSTNTGGRGQWKSRGSRGSGSRGRGRGSGSRGRGQ